MSSHHFNTNPTRLTQKEFTQLAVWEAEGPRPDGSTHSLLLPVLPPSFPLLSSLQMKIWHSWRKLSSLPRAAITCQIVLQQEEGKAGFFCFGFESLTLCNPCSPYIDQTDLGLRNQHALVSRILILEACFITPGPAEFCCCLFVSCFFL